METENSLYNLLIKPNGIKVAFEPPQVSSYFENLHEKVIQRIENEDIKDDLWQQISKEVPYRLLAEDYFKTLPGVIAETVIDEHTILPATNQWPAKVPESYFETLPQQVLEKARGKGRVVKFTIFKKLTVAAAVLIAVVTGWVVYTNYNQASIKGYNIVKKEMKNISGAYIDSYVAETEGVSPSEKIPLTGHNDFKKLMQSVPDNVIDNFLETVDKNSAEEQEEIL